MTRGTRGSLNKGQTQQDILSGVERKRKSAAVSNVVFLTYLLGGVMYISRVCCVMLSDEKRLIGTSLFVNQYLGLFMRAVGEAHDTEL